jgi:hypothetical protein
MLKFNSNLNDQVVNGGGTLLYLEPMKIHEDVIVEQAAYIDKKDSMNRQLRYLEIVFKSPAGQSLTTKVFYPEKGSFSTLEENEAAVGAVLTHISEAAITPEGLVQLQTELAKCKTSDEFMQVIADGLVAFPAKVRLKVIRRRNGYADIPSVTANAANRQGEKYLDAAGNPTMQIKGIPFIEPMTVPAGESKLTFTSFDQSESERGIQARAEKPNVGGSNGNGKAIVGGASAMPMV